ncbi:RNA 2',3'-cyclic phosphodiesterase [Sporosarcina sp. Marseille-Q4063]|uniref:RNA 2',3'-cyclic phosphodiesterase n=1 Tax=Sporosarcina sp. Marseille-Q4063 TaxID=2810514 RepID=UPI001BAE9877|nr:RNA 2',3'-cyclic phosphodiesterase [Sporosarcina sp. Marseille-Q4063]QUW21457.1 RNA 2',3'-cyclic phosphodiesterase [Sporosarcina sp. Marseille-Q4063]
MSAHYFIGIKSPTTLEHIMDSYKAKYQLTEVYKVIPHPEDLHVTLLFIGAMSEQSLPSLIESLRMIADKTPVFNMQIDGLSFFGSPSGPRVVYLSIEENKALSALQKEIDETIAAQFNRPVSDRFTPHITIAKKRKTTKKLFIQKEKWEPIEVPVSSFALFTIHPHKSPKYEAVENFLMKQ